MKIMLINGPSVNMTGAKEIDAYGKTAFDAMIENLEQVAARKGHMLTCFQSNSEGQLIDWLQQAHFEHYDGVILNPGDEFSYNDTVGPRTYARGFKDAIVYSGATAEV